MALTWDMTNVDMTNPLVDYGPGVKEEDSTVEQNRAWGYVEAAIFMTMGIGIGQWTEENIDEVVERVRLWEAKHGPTLTFWPESEEKPKDVPLPEDVIRAMVGLRTNAGYEPKKKWMARVLA